MTQINRHELAEMVALQIPAQIRTSLEVTITTDAYLLAPCALIRTKPDALPYKSWKFQLELEVGPDGSWVRTKLPDAARALLGLVI